MNTIKFFLIEVIIQYIFKIGNIANTSLASRARQSLEGQALSALLRRAPALMSKRLMRRAFSALVRNASDAVPALAGSYTRQSVQRSNCLLRSHARGSF